MVFSRNFEELSIDFLISLELFVHKNDILRVNPPKFFKTLSLSLINNRMGRKGIDREAFEVGFKGWDWSMGSIQDPWYAGFHPRAARFLVEFLEIFIFVS